MKTTKMMRILTVVLAVLMLAATFTACGGQKITVTVNDNDTKTEVETETGKTVGEVLETAKITLGDKDECEPKTDEKITEDTKEITIKRNAKVTIVKDGAETEVEVVGGTVADALKKANITLAEGESTDVALETKLTDGMKITVIKSFKVTLTADGKSNELSTAAKTVQALLDEQKITLGKDDEISEKLDAALADGMKITVKRVTYKDETATETVDYETVEQYDSSMAQGTSEVTQSGVEGEKTITYKVKYIDGKEDSREVVSEEITKEPVNQIITYGTYTAPATQAPQQSGGRTVVSKTPVYDCDGSGHGYYDILYSDGEHEYVEF